MSTDEGRISLRVMVPAEDGTAVVEMTSPAVPENGLQAFGDWVLAALEQRTDGQPARLGPWAWGCSSPFHISVGPRPSRRPQARTRADAPLVSAGTSRGNACETPGGRA